MKNLRTEYEITINWQDSVNEPVVSICCVTYNHESFIEDAINGFLIQETDFPFEILIHDDASTDRTADIIREYEAKYPKLIKPIYQTENQYSKNIRPMWDFLYPKVEGKYCAFCEGDDYWIDPKKLQKQVDYLEEHPNVVISSFDAFIIDEFGKQVSNSKLPTVHHKDYTGKELLQGEAWLLTMNWLFRKINLPNIPERYRVFNGDTFSTSILGQYGSSHHHTDIKPSAYRMHSGGVWSSLKEQDKLEAQQNSFFWMYKYYKRINLPEVATVFYSKFENSVSRLASLNEVSKLSQQITYQSFNKLEASLNNLPKNKKHLIYGYSSFGRYLAEKIGNNFIGYLDSNANTLNQPNIYNPEEVLDLNYDYIIISLLGREDAVIDAIKTNTPSNKILFFDKDFKIPRLD